MLAQDLLVIVGAIIATTGGARNAVFGWRAECDDHLQRPDRQIRFMLLPFKTIRTTRSRSFGEYLFVVLLMMLHPSQVLEPPANPERFTSVVDLQAAINRFIAEHNATKAIPFVWRADPDDIFAARNRGSQMLDSIH